MHACIYSVDLPLLENTAHLWYNLNKDASFDGLKSLPPNNVYIQYLSQTKNYCFWYLSSGLSCSLSVFSRKITGPSFATLVCISLKKKIFFLFFLLQIALAKACGNGSQLGLETKSSSEVVSQIFQASLPISKQSIFTVQKGMNETMR